MMKTPVLLVTVALTVAILLAASLVIATGTRGEDGKAMVGGTHPPRVVSRGL
jgi:aldose sugar dehydrogenase